MAPIRTGWGRSCVATHEDTNSYLEVHYVAKCNQHYAQPAVAEDDYHRRRPTMRHFDAVFWLEEERVVGEDRVAG